MRHFRFRSTCGPNPARRAMKRCCRAVLNGGDGGSRAPFRGTPGGKTRIHIGPPVACDPLESYYFGPFFGPRAACKVAS